MSTKINSIGHNLTGGQIQRLTTFLFLSQALRPLYVLTTVLDSLPYDLLNATLCYPKRKLSGLPTDEFINGLAQVMAQPKKSKAWSSLIQLRIERIPFIKRVSKFLKDYEQTNYSQLYTDYLTDPTPAKLQKLREIEALFGAKPDKLFCVYNHTKLFCDEFFEFRSNIISQFLYMSQKSAGVYFKHRTRSLNFDDLLQNIRAAITKAIDRYDSSRGSLVPHIQCWVKNSQAQDPHADGLAYEVPNSTKVSIAAGRSDRVNFAISLSNELGEDLTLQDTLVSNSPSPEMQLQQAQEENRMLFLIKSADVKGLFRLSNGIQEVFFPFELERMKAHMLENNL